MNGKPDGKENNIWYQHVKGSQIAAAIPYILAGIVCLCISVPIRSKSLYYDEGYSIDLARKTVGGLVRGTAADVHPPLYYLLLKLFSLIGGESIVKYRLITACGAYFNLFWLGATRIRKRWNPRVATFYILWFGAAYSTIIRSVSIRMYSWGAFFVTAAALGLLAWYEEGGKRRFISAVLFTLAAMYTHYYAALAVFVAWGILFSAVLITDRRRVGKVLLGGLLATVGYLPWMSVVVTQTQQVADGYWIEALDWEEWIMAPAEVMESSLTGIGLVFCVVAAALVLTAVIRRKWDALICFAVFAGTMVGAALISVWIVPIWNARYLYVVWGMLSLSTAIMAGEYMGRSSCVFQVLLLLLLSVEMFFSVETIRQSEMMTSTAEQLVEFLDENVEEGACIFLDDPEESKKIYGVYMPQVEFVMVKDLTGEDGGELLRTVLEQGQERQMWYIINYVQIQLGTDGMREMLERNGYEMEYAISCTIEERQLEIYRIGSRDRQ